MKHYLLLYTSIIAAWFVLHETTTLLPRTNYSPAVEANMGPPPCGPSCQLIDSLSLVAVYNALNGPAWTAGWVLNDPVCSWPGVTLDVNGFVRELSLNSNGLSGVIPPSIGLFPQLRILQLDNNSITGSIPAQIGMLSNLNILFLDDNMISGDLPIEFGDLQSLTVVFLDNNLITGTIPAALATNSFQRFEFFNNLIDSLPDFSGVANFQDNYFKFQNNRLTFDDILPNLSDAVGTYYQPQDSICEVVDTTVYTGSSYTFDLDIDDGISDNVYTWYKDGLPFGTPGNSNQMTIAGLNFSDAGEYTCEVTNPGAPLLTLYCRPTTLTIVCAPSIFNMTDTLCSGQSISVNGNFYSEINPTGTELLSIPAQNGCDSIVNIDLSFIAPPTTNFSPTLCPGETVWINGTEYGPGLSTGVEVFEDAVGPGCDSLVVINLSFLSNLPSSNYNATLCATDEVMINGTAYNASNPSGIEILDDASAQGCDSLVTVNLSFYPVAEITHTPTLCPGEVFTINGSTYDVNTPTGTQTIPNASPNGCDSIINIDLSFFSPVSNTITNTLCADETLTVNGTVYSNSNPAGVEILSGMAANGCDSTVNIDLSFYPMVSSDFSTIFCPGEEVVVNGTVYNEFNPAGSEVFTDAAANGCDSIVSVNLTYLSNSVTNYGRTLCPGQTENINGTVYSASNPIGTEIFAGLAANGCDSVVHIAFDYYAPLVSTFAPTFCANQEITINGTLYNQSNPTGNEVFTAASNGCDSTVMINISFGTVASGNFSPTLCPNENVVINGTTYDASNPTGAEWLVGMGTGGCDSVVNVNLNFYQPIVETYNLQLCTGGITVVNGTTYDASNPTGTEVFTAMSNGCDSTVMVNLTFGAAASGDFSPTLCANENVVVNGTSYDAANPVGTEILPGMGAGGCDSIVNVKLNFYQPITETYNLQLCTGGSVVVNGTIYDVNNPTGSEVLTATSNGCDSTVLVNLTFGTAIVASYNPSLCFGESVQINGTQYDQSNPDGSETFVGMGSGGCDSTVVIALSFLTAASSDYNESICQGESLVINNTTYGAGNLTGTEILSSAAANGCDSIININLNLLPEASRYYTPQVCSNENLVINGSVYDFNNPSGIEILSGMASNGCDSILNIQLSFASGDTTYLDTTICQGSNLEINNTIYDENNAAGIEVINLPSGCDSVIVVTLSFSTVVSYEMEESFCDSTFVTVGNETFGPDNPSGQVLLPGQSQNGCDSLVMVSLSYNFNTTEEYSEIVCEGGELSINGTIYNEANPTGTEILPGMAIGGCDSTLNISLTFIPEIIDTFTGPLCFGSSFEINGTTYDANNTMGVEVFEGGSVDGCDSTVVVDLELLDPITFDFTENFCTNANIEINGTVYDAANPTGQELLIGESFYGCDSLININLTFGEIVTIAIDTVLCEGLPLQIGDEIMTDEGIYEVTLSGANSGGCDSIITVNLIYEDPFVYGAANAGEDLIDCTNSVILEGIQNPGQFGFWTSQGLAILDHINQANTGITNLQPGPNTFIWNVNSQACPNYDQDVMVVTYLPLPVPFEDSIELDFAVSTFELPLLANDSFPWPETPYTVTASIDTGGIIIQENDTTVLFAPQPSFEGIINGTYSICGVLCPGECYEQVFTINLTNDFWGKDDEWQLPNGITPNGDGANDQFIIDPLLENPDEYPNNELVIFNRYGTTVFRARPYLNDWDGRSMQGTELPEGTYYYVLRLNLSEGEVHKGDVTIIR